MKKLYSVLSVFAFVLMMLTGPAFAGSTVVNTTLGAGTNLNTTWTGTSGDITQNVNLGPTSAVVYNGGGTFQGIANFSNAGGNPYGYGVPSTTTFVSSSFTGGGQSALNLTRTSSYVPMYGPAGENIMGNVQSDQIGAMALTVNTNYAALGIGNYAQPNVAGGGQFSASGNFLVQHQVTDGSGNFANFQNTGNGTTRINSMSSDVDGSSFNFGAGQGCYTNATVVSTGSGQFLLNGVAAHNLNAPGLGLSIPGGGSLNATVNYNSGLSISNFSVNGN